MQLPFEVFVGLRYTRAKRRNRFISLISLISVLGTALGMTALITVLSVMNGFQREVRARIIGAAAHVQIIGKDGALRDWERVAGQAGKNANVLASAPFVQADGLLSVSQTVRGTVIRGILPEYEARVDDIAGHMKVGALTDLRPGEFGIVLGVELARALHVTKGDKVTLLVPPRTATHTGVLPRLKQFTVVGAFEIGHFEIDQLLALIHLSDAQEIYELSDAVSGVRLKLSDPMRAPRVAYELADNLRPGVHIDTWIRMHANYFYALQHQKRIMTIILTLIIIVSTFNVISTLVMVVTEKRADIAILRTLGASPRSIMQIFMVEGAVVGAAGTLLGLIGGVLLAYNVSNVMQFIERALGIRFLAREVYFISELPSDPWLADIITVAGVALVLSLLATVYPSYRAARVRPAEALRHE